MKRKIITFSLPASNHEAIQNKLDEICNNYKVLDIFAVAYSSNGSGSQNTIAHYVTCEISNLNS